MNTQSEIKRYKELVKEQEKQIKALVYSNKHIKAHIKYLEAQLPSVASVVENEKHDLVKVLENERLEKGE